MYEFVLGGLFGLVIALLLINFFRTCKTPQVFVIEEIEVVAQPTAYWQYGPWGPWWWYGSGGSGSGGMQAQGYSGGTRSHGE